MSTSTTETFTVTGMTCDHCVRSVTEEVGAVDGVTDVRVDLASGRVEVASGHPVTVEKIREAVEEAGYRLADA